MELKTPLYENHLKLEGKMVDFAGYILPVQYKTGIIKEHMAVRTKAGIFDVSHMGEVIISGKDALENINKILTNDFTNMKVGQIRYTLMCNQQGGIVDDLIVYKLEEKKYMLVVNASNRGKDIQWIKENLSGDVKLEDISDDIALVALQGPNSQAILEKIADKDALPQKYYTFTDKVSVGGKECLVSRTGYTGEHGYEIYMNADDAVEIWELLLAKGENEGLIPCGLGARDTLRFEASMPLYGNEMTDDISPFQVGLNFAVKMDKADFVGKSALLEKKPTRKRTGLEVVGRGIVRDGQKVYSGDKEVGITSTGTHVPYLEKALAMAFIDLDYIDEGTELEVDVRGRRVPVKTVDLPFMKKD